MLFLNKKHLNYLMVSLLISTAYGRDDKPTDSLGVNQRNETTSSSKDGKALKVSESFFIKRGRMKIPTYNEAMNQKSSLQAANEKKPFELRFSGYARMWGFYRHLTDYENLSKGLYPQSTSNADVLKEYPTAPTNLSLSDGYQEPLALIRIEGNPSLKTWFQMEYYFDHRINRILNSPYNSINTDANGRAAAVYRIFQFTGGMHTKIGTFKLTAGGGVNWFKLSPFTLWQYQNRDDMFERYPWEPEGNDFNRYNSLYSQGDIPRDQRWGNQGTQGFIIEATGLPKNFDLSIVYGKNQNSGGFVSGSAVEATGNFSNVPPQNMFAGRIGKKVGAHKLGFNMFNQYGYFEQNTDSMSWRAINYQNLPMGKDSSTYFIEKNRVSQLILTVDGRFNFDKFKLYTELGAGAFTDSTYNNGVHTEASNVLLHYLSKPWLNNPYAKNAYTYKKKWSPALFAEIELDRSLLNMAVKFSAYHIGEGVVNNTSAINNTSIENFRASPGQGNANVINYYQGMVTEINQYANNRQGVNLTTGFNAGRFKLGVDYANSQEITNLYNDKRTGFGRSNTNDGGTMGNGITFQHRVNQLATSRFGYFERYLGPYSRIMNVYRRTYENVQITDTAVDYKKSFNTMDFSMKYKAKVGGKDIIFSYYINYNSVQDKVSPIPVFTNKAFLRQFYEEFLTFYNIHPKFTILGFAGYERVIGNQRTELAAPTDDFVAANGQTYNKGDLLIDKTTNKVFYDARGKAINQFGYGFGLGFDWEYMKRSTLNVRARKYGHHDRNQVKDTYAGYEVTTELKIFF